MLITYRQFLKQHKIVLFNLSILCSYKNLIKGLSNAFNNLSLNIYDVSFFQFIVLII